MSDELTLLDIETGLIEKYDDLDECQTDEERAQANQAIEAYLKAEVEKVEKIRAYILHEEAQAEIHRKESERQRLLAVRHEAHVEHVKDFCKRVLTELGKTKVPDGRTTARGVIKIQKNGGKLPLEIYDESIIPAQFIEIIYRTNTDAVRKELEAGRHVPGAKLGERGVHVRVE